MARGPADGAKWRCCHGGPGRYDESARRASHEELAVAQMLVDEGHDVRTVAERPQQRAPDMVACGMTVEVKSFRSLEERGGRRPGAPAVANKLLDGRGQGDLVVIWAPGSGLQEATARAGYRLFCQESTARGLDLPTAARVIGDGFDLSFAPRAGVPGPGRARAQRPVIAPTATSPGVRAMRM